MTRLQCGLALLLCVSAAERAAAQIGTSTITGRVTDPSGAVVPGAAVAVVHTATNFKFSTVTNDDGLYRVLSLNPGLYRITAEAPGFKRSVRDEVELRTGDTLPVDFTLQVGNVTEAVEVTGAATLLETETSATGTLVAGQVLYDMPLYQRYVNSTMNLVPGMTSGGYAYGGDLGAYHLAGQRSGAIGIFEDGVNGNDQQSGVGTVKPLLNSVADVVTTPAFDMDAWQNGGPDRFTHQNRPAVVDINAFAWPGGCGNVTSSVNPAECNFRVGNAGRNILTGPGLMWSQVSAQKNFRFTERWNAQLRWDFQNALKTYNFTFNNPSPSVDFRNPRNFGKLTDDPRTASLGGQPLMNLTLMIQF